MTEPELKDKIVSAIIPIIEPSDELIIIETMGEKSSARKVAERVAEALIAAGIGDIREAELERKAYEVASTQYRIWFEEQKDRAEVAEKALDLCETAYILSLNHRATEGISGQAIASDLGVHKFFIKQAEKELAEEGKE